VKVTVEVSKFQHQSEGQSFKVKRFSQRQSVIVSKSQLKSTPGSKFQSQNKSQSQSRSFKVKVIVQALKFLSRGRVLKLNIKVKVEVSKF